MSEWKTIDSAPKDGTPIMVSFVPSTTKPPRNAVRWCRGPAKSSFRWRILGAERHPLRYKPNIWTFLPSPPSP